MATHASSALIAEILENEWFAASGLLTVPATQLMPSTVRVKSRHST